MPNPNAAPVQVAPSIYHCLYRPNWVDDLTTGAGAFEHTHAVPAAPWLSHQTNRAAAPGHIVALAQQIMQTQTPLSVTDGTKTITMQPTLIGLTITTTADGSFVAWAHVGWAQNPATGPFLHSARVDLTLPDSFMLSHRAFLRAEEAAIHVSL